uniref:Putative secreted protein n=1 Tax=Rhipicephalus microplus TaxID=6941 RepID=A0A6M2DAE7_RHIMP
MFCFFFFFFLLVLVLNLAVKLLPRSSENEGSRNDSATYRCPFLIALRTSLTWEFCRRKAATVQTLHYRCWRNLIPQWLF